MPLHRQLDQRQRLARALVAVGTRAIVKVGRDGDAGLEQQFERVFRPFPRRRAPYLRTVAGDALERSDAAHQLVALLLRRERHYRQMTVTVAAELVPAAVY